MIQKPMDVLQYYQVRKSKKQKTAFLTDASAYAAALRYPTKIEKGSFGSRNLIVGDPEKAEYLLTAHYDTCPWMPVPNFITPFNLLAYILYQLFICLFFGAIAFVVALTVNLVFRSALGQQSMESDLRDGIRLMIAGFAMIAFSLIMVAGPANRHTANDNTSGVVTLLEIMATLPENLRSKVCFVLFDLEEAGLIGSASYRKQHKAATDRQTVINLDCVGDGDEILLIPVKKLRKDTGAMERLQTLSGTWGKKSIHIHEKGFAFYPSDQANFPKGVAVAAFRRNRLLGRYLGRIHTHRDTVLEYTNVNILRAALISLICRDA